MIYKNIERSQLVKRFLLFIIAFPIWCQAQLVQKDSLRIDSLKQVISSTAIDTIKIQSWQSWDEIINIYEQDLSFEINEKIINYSKEIVDNSDNVTPEKEIVYFRKAIGTSYYNIGQLYRRNEDYAKALQSYLPCLQIFESLEYSKGIGYVKFEIGIIFFIQGEYSQAIKYVVESIEKNEEIGNKHQIAQGYSIIGQVYEIQKDYDKAIINQKKAIEIIEELDDNVTLANFTFNLAVVYANSNDLEKALEYLYKDLELLKKDGERPSYLISAISEVLGNLGNYTEGIVYGEEALKMAYDTGSFDDINRAALSLYSNYKRIGNSSQALKMHETYIAYSDSLKNKTDKKAAILFESERKFAVDSILNIETQKVKDAQLTTAKVQNEKQQQRSWFLLAGLIGALFFGIFIFKQKKTVEIEKRKSENLLLNILPSEIAEELKIKGKADAKDFDMASILFTDFKGFTQISEKLSAKELITEISHCFEAFDHICGKYHIEKIKTIGDAYMAAGGLPVPSDESLKNTILAALDMQSFITERIIEKRANGETPFEMRLGIHTGPVVAGIVGVKKFQYDIWGDTVNTASRMESSGKTGEVNISEFTYNLIKDDRDFIFESRGKIKAKGKGEIEMYLVSKA